ncbi:hypothetical protein [Thorsellia kenyensis]|uniref:DUF4388 domain-containing protein n=1 Tax=Thorsellia kenyensis TaxID=1549888 RepID=A0ABV6CAV6_9GAMM
MLNKEEILKLTLDILIKIKGKPIKICNGYNKFSLYAYGEEVLLYKRNGCYLKIDKQSKINQISNFDLYKSYVRKEESEEHLLVLESSICENVLLYKRLICFVIKEAQAKNSKKITELKNFPLCSPSLSLTKEMVAILEKINVRTFNDFRTLGPLAIISILMSYKMNPSYSMLLKLESIDKQIPIFLLDEKTIMNLKKFWKKVDELNDQ